MVFGMAVPVSPAAIRAAIPWAGVLTDECAVGWSGLGSEDGGLAGVMVGVGGGADGGESRVFLRAPMARRTARFSICSPEGFASPSPHS